MPPFVGPSHAVALVLAFAGVAKLSRPAGTAAALRVLGLPGRRNSARLLGALEVAAAVWLLAGGGALAAAAVGAFHVGFTGAAVLLRRRAATCGCFGAGAPVTGAHLVTTVVATLVAAVAVADPVPSLGATAGTMPAAGVPYVGLVVLLAALEVVALTALAEVQAARREVVLS